MKNMKNKVQIEAFALPFHIERSKSHIEIVSKPLQSYCSFTFQKWDGIHLPSVKNIHTRHLFFQYPPPEELLLDKKARLIWIPMWDHVRYFSDSYWMKLPKTLKVLAFSKSIFQKATKYGLPTLYLQYFPNTEKLKKTNWNKERVLFYWNRIGLIGQDDLSRLCNALNINTLYFQNQLDPGILKSLNYKLPSKLKNTNVVYLQEYLPKEQYMQYLNKSNIYLAPRRYEGIGISYIEALSRGNCVLGVNAPTMNEYIIHKQNGYLLSYRSDEKFFPNIKRIIGIRIPKIFGGIRHQIRLTVDWNELKYLCLEDLGIQARKYCENGYQKWRNDREKYADFILN